jgi:hypothetical protein
MHVSLVPRGRAELHFRIGESDTVRRHTNAKMAMHVTCIDIKVTQPGYTLHFKQVDASNCRRHPITRTRRQVQVQVQVQTGIANSKREKVEGMCEVVSPYQACSSPFLCSFNYTPEVVSVPVLWTLCNT